MLKSLLQRAREARSELGDGEGLEEGFTLIELMVVLLIIAILLAIAIPTFLGVTNSASDRASQSNLTNALTESKAIYQNNSNYIDPATNNPILTTAAFTTSAPEFKWVQGVSGAGGGCNAASGNNCMSMQIVDVGAPVDGQGLVTATFSQKDSTCWYAVDLEAAPVSITDTNYPGTGTPAGVPFVATGVAPTVNGAAAANAGVYYAKKTASVSATNCNANWAATQSAFKWGSSYASAPSN
jgi:prepilin-type N-terminal cleavage/methylation domain-containing protein